MTRRSRIRLRNLLRHVVLTPIRVIAGCVAALFHPHATR